MLGKLVIHLGGNVKIKKKIRSLNIKSKIKTKCENLGYDIYPRI